MKAAVKAFVQRRYPAPWLHYRAFDALVRDSRSYLHQTGWLRSLDEGRPVDAQGQPVPWMNYAAIAFLDERLRSRHALFEYGSGASTAFFAARVAHVTSVEYDETWLAQVKQTAPANVTLVFRAHDEDGAYCRTITGTGRAYDVVIVDGRDRVNCLRQSVEALTPGGVLVLDDSERPRYAPGAAFLRDRGFRALRFEGLKPTGTATDQTTVFYRPDNAFDL
jgi:hypothetical protein